MGQDGGAKGVWGGGGERSSRGAKGRGRWWGWGGGLCCGSRPSQFSELQ